MHQTQGWFHQFRGLGNRTGYVSSCDEAFVDVNIRGIFDHFDRPTSRVAQQFPVKLMLV